MAVDAGTRTQKLRHENIHPLEPVPPISQSITTIVSELDELNDWMGAQLKLNSLVPYEFPDTGRGMQATGNIAGGTVLISVGAPYCYTAAYARRLRPEIPSNFPALTCLTAFLLLEDEIGPKSLIAPYLNSLPKTFANPLLLFHGEIPTSLCSNLTDLLRKQRQDWIEAKKLLSWRAFSEKKMFWAWFAIQTRTLFITPSHPALVPYLDLLNHSPDANVTTRWNSDTESFEIITNTTYTAGEQVFINYGSHDNRKLAVYYGFTIPRNSFSTVEIDFDLVLKYLPVTPAQEEFLKKYSAWRPLQMSWEGFAPTSILFLHARLTAKKDLWKILDCDEMPCDQEARRILLQILRVKLDEMSSYFKQTLSFSSVLASVYDEAVGIIERNIDLIKLRDHEPCYDRAMP